MSNSIVSLDATAGAGISELPSLLKRWLALAEEMTTLNNELKERRKQSTALKTMILRIMESNKVAALNTSKGTVVHKTKESSEKLSNASLLKHCKDFFGGDEERAKALLAYIEDHRGTTVRSDLRIQVPKGAEESDRTSNRS
jgi:hypothetical protein